MQVVGKCVERDRSIRMGGQAWPKHAACLVYTFMQHLRCTERPFWRVYVERSDLLVHCDEDLLSARELLGRVVPDLLGR